MNIREESLSVLARRNTREIDKVTSPCASVDGDVLYHRRGERHRGQGEKSESDGGEHDATEEVNEGSVEETVECVITRTFLVVDQTGPARRELARWSALSWRESNESLGDA